MIPHVDCSIRSLCETSVIIDIVFLDATNSSDGHAWLSLRLHVTRSYLPISSTHPRAESGEGIDAERRKPIDIHHLGPSAYGYQQDRASPQKANPA